MRRLIPLLLAAAFVATGCGTERPGAAVPVESGGPPSIAPPSASPTPSGDLDGFPLDLGYDAENGDDHSPVRVTHRPDAVVYDVCDHQVVDPRVGTTDVLGVEWRGEAEWLRGRTLALYPSAEDAAAALATARDRVTSCPDDPGDPGYGVSHTVVDGELGDESVAWVDTFWFISDEQKLHDTGMTVHHVVRVGRAVLLAYEYGEGNGSDESRAIGIDRATELERPVVAAMDVVD